MNEDALFDFVVKSLMEDPRVTSAKMFGSPGLRTGGKVFATLVKGKLVVKLSERRVDAIVAAGQGKRFDPGMGRLMKEWAAVEPSEGDAWLTLATEARDYVASAK